MRPCAPWNRPSGSTAYIGSARRRAVRSDLQMAWQPTKRVPCRQPGTCPVFGARFRRPRSEANGHAGAAEEIDRVLVQPDEYMGVELDVVGQKVRDAGVDVVFRPDPGRAG